MSGQERRQKARVSIQQFIEVSYNRETYMTASAQDLSEEGIRVRTNDRLDAGARVFLMFGLKNPDGSPLRDFAGNETVIKTEGIVVHATADDGVWTLGVRFEDMEARDRSTLNRYLKEADS